ncbi:MAG: hypothetical protein JSR93_06310 [Verrucomicrobia bacterium]|nr:hypothetical protein [Verrucomicrobiota bacterium]
MLKGRFFYDNQNFFHLACIQSTSLGLSGIVLGKKLAAIYGAGTAICSIAIGNLILWLVAIAVISMADKVKGNAIDNIKEYLGKYGGMIASLILMIAVLNWFAYQITFSMDAMNNLIKGGIEDGMLIRIGAALGLFCSLLALGGIHLLRKITVFSFPLLICYHCLAILATDRSVSVAGTWGLSFTAVTTSVLILLPGAINLPTFFRHSRSRAHSFLALTLMTLFITFFEVTTIWIDFFSSTVAGTVLVTVFILVILTYCNLVNIYLASASWETFSSRFGEPKGFAIIGLFGTLTYTFIQISTPVQFLQDLTNAYIATLGIVLLLAYLTRLIVRHRPRPLEKRINIATWLFGCLIATLYEVQHFLKGTEALFAGINASLLLYMGTIFIEETLWAVKVRFGGRKVFRNNLKNREFDKGAP